MYTYILVIHLIRIFQSKPLLKEKKELGNDVIAITDHVEFAQKNILQTINSLTKREKEIRKI